MTLTARQSEIVEFFRDYQAVHEMGPSIRNVMDHFGFKSPNSVMIYVKPLLEIGALRRLNVPEGTPRSIVATTKEMHP